jgi:transcriptional regulator with XRE-family HTH domain
MHYQTIDEANQAVAAKIVAGSPFLVDVVPAKSVIKEFNEGKVLLHAGPPIKYEQMVDPIQGACVGAALFEGWAENEADARKLLESGEVTLIPCHHVNAVGPMGGITSANMAVLIVENRTDGNRAFCTMNEGIGAVLRFGAYSDEVITRLRWMRDVLGPTLSKALQTKKGGLNVNVLVATAIEQAGGPTISATYVWQLRKGLRDNPTKHHIEALAGFFGVPASYFLDDDTAAEIDAQLELLAAIRDAKVAELALRAQGLSSASLDTIADMIERVRQLEGLPNGSDDDR